MFTHLCVPLLTSYYTTRMYYLYDTVEDTNATELVARIVHTYP